jgi:uncharacterized protein (DUF1330 family)
MPGYLIANLDIRDTALFQKYRDQVAPLIKRFGGRYLVRGGELRSVEGALPVKRLIVLEFPSLAEAQRFYDSDEYRPILQLRLDSCVSDVVLVEGYSEAA